MMEFTFEPAAWEAALEGATPGSALSATRFLALMEQETEQDLEDALDYLAQKDILLDISDLPSYSAAGDTAVRLRREAQLVEENMLPGALDENDPLRLYLQEIESVAVDDDAQTLAEKLLAGDESARQPLMDMQLKRVVQASYALAGRGVLLLDLIQEGSLSLWQAMMDYAGGDVDKYCDRAIARGLAVAVTLQARSSGVGQRLRQAMEDYRDVDQRLLAELGRNPTLEEIAQQLHMSAEETAVVAKTLESARLVGSVTADEQPDEPQPEDEQAVEDTAYFQMRQRIAELLENVSPEEAKLLSLRFGLEGGQPLSPEETGKRLGLTPEEVVAGETAALMKLRQAK